MPNAHGLYNKVLWVNIQRVHDHALVKYKTSSCVRDQLVACWKLVSFQLAVNKLMVSCQLAGCYRSISGGHQSVSGWLATG